MELVMIYEDYVKVNKAYISFVEALVNTDFTGFEEVEIQIKLEEAQQDFDSLMKQSEACQVDAENEVNLQDLRYLVVDSFFLSMDLNHFYTHKELGRFKMRALNHLNKKKRADFFGEDSTGTCRVQ